MGLSTPTETVDTAAPTRAMQRYAAEIYRLQQDHDHVSLALLADMLEVTAQAVSRMVRRLDAAGLVTHTRYRGVRLTPAGERFSLPAIRRHRLVEVFLVDVMRFGIDEVHPLADVLENGIDDHIEARIDDLTGHPRHCPHGDPIPDRDGRMPVLDDGPLSAYDGTRAAVSRVRTHDGEKMRYIYRIGARPGAALEIVSRAPFNGPLTLRIDGEIVVVGREVADAVWVRRDDPATG